MWRRDFFFARDLSLENFADSYLCFWQALFDSVSHLYFLYPSPSSCLCTIFDAVLSNIDEVLSINPSPNVFVFEYFNAYHKDKLNYSGRTKRPGELFCNFSNDVTQMVNFSSWISDCESLSNGLLDLFLCSDVGICSIMAFCPLENSDQVVLSVSTDFPSISRLGVPLLCIAYDHYCADWGVLHDHLRDVPWKDIFKLSASAAATDFRERFQVGIDVYIPHH